MDESCDESIDLGLVMIVSHHAAEEDPSVK